jgi:hypothetical protein
MRSYIHLTGRSLGLEKRMRKTMGLILALGFVLAAPAVQAADAHPAHRHRQHRTPGTARPTGSAPAAESLLPTLTPYTRSGEGNNNGLSRDPDDCATGCIGGNAD